MNIVLEIMAKAGFKAEELFWIKVTHPPYMDLTIEGIGVGPRGLPAISVCHYGEQNGDLMRDPEMCFEVLEDKLHAYYFRNDYAGIEEDVRNDEVTAPYSESSRQRDRRHFANLWFNNIRTQGFLSGVVEVNKY